MDSSSQPNQTVDQPSLFHEVFDTAPYERNMRNARTWLYVIAGLQFIMGIFEYASTPDKTIGWLAFGIDATVALVFTALAWGSRKKPVLCFTTALVLYALFVVGLAILDTSNIYRGIIIKIFAFIALVKANRDARKFEEIRSSIGEPL